MFLCYNTTFAQEHYWTFSDLDQDNPFSEDEQHTEHSGSFLSPDGALVGITTAYFSGSSVQSDLIILDTRTKKELQRFTSPPGRKNTFLGVSFSHDNTYVAFTTKHSLYVYDFTRGTPILESTLDDYFPEFTLFSKDDASLYSVSTYDPDQLSTRDPNHHLHVHKWSLKDGTGELILSHVYARKYIIAAVDVSRDHTTIAFAHGHHTTFFGLVAVYDLQSKDLICHNEDVGSTRYVSFSHSGLELALVTGYADVLQVISASTCQTKWHVDHPEKDQIGARFFSSQFIGNQYVIFTGSKKCKEISYVCGSWGIYDTDQQRYTYFQWLSDPEDDILKDWPGYPSVQNNRLSIYTDKRVYFWDISTMLDHLVATSIALDQETSIEEMVLFPNPTTDWVSLSGSLYDQSGSGTFSVYNVLGQSVFSFTGMIKDNQIEIGHLPPGLYLYKLEDDHQNVVFSGKFLKN